MSDTATADPNKDKPTDASTKTEKPTAPKKAEKIVPKKAEKVEPELSNVDGDVVDNSKYAEPKGTLHTDQYNTQFPGEKTARPS